MFLYFQEKIIPAENVDIFLNQTIRPLHIVANERLRDLARDASAQTYQALVILSQEFLIDSGFVVNTL